jgi:hypothetical protein
VGDLVKCIGQKPASNRRLGFFETSGAGQGQSPTTDEVPPIPPVHLGLGSLPLLELGRISQIETVEERSSVERNRRAEGGCALRTDLIQRVLVGETAQILRVPDVDPGQGEIQRHTVAIGDEGSAPKTGAKR